MTKSMNSLLVVTTLVLALGPGRAIAESVSAESLEGAWELVSYEFAGGAPDVDGLQLMADGRFSIAYSMQYPDTEQSARTHAGTYRVQDDKILYEVEWWVQKVGAECGIVPPVTESPAFEYDGSNLRLMFASGSTQHWRRIP